MLSLLVGIVVIVIVVVIVLVVVLIVVVVVSVMTNNHNINSLGLSCLFDSLRLSLFLQPPAAFLL